MNKIQNLRNQLEQSKGKKDQIKQSIKKIKGLLIDNKQRLVEHEQAREIMREVSLKTQQQLQYHISDITTLALDAVFPEPYALIAEFVKRRNKIDCDLYFVRDGEKIDPINASGGGAVDVAALSLRVASWSMNRPRTRNTIILDEPMRFLSRDLQEKASLMLKEISKKLNIQFIIITHETTLTEHANQIFQTQLKQGKTKII
ncbi:MAG: hypothetical protein ACLFVR_14685 [Thiohalospira sp.]